MPTPTGKRDCPGPTGCTPIHIAAFSSQDRVLKALAEVGADMNARDTRRYGVIARAAVAERRRRSGPW